jgi:N-carbamoylputrescine amidase
MRTPDPKTFTLGLVQMRCVDDPAANLDKAVNAVHRAARNGAEIICLQELFRTPYFCQRQDPAVFDLAESIPGPSTEHLAAAARDTSTVVVASLFERRAAGLFHNTAVVFDADGSMAGLYRKMHIPDDPLYFEKYYFTPGDLGFRSFDTHFGKVGVLVCWDQWFPEAARLTALQGAEVILYPTAIGWHPREKEEFGAAQHDAWELVQRSHAVANGVFVAAVNRVGHEAGPGPGLDFWGQSFVCDPFGVVLARGSSDGEEMLVVPCERSRLEEVRRNWPFYRDRRVDAYGDLTRRWAGGPRA